MSPFFIYFLRGIESLVITNVNISSVPGLELDVLRRTNFHAPQMTSYQFLRLDRLHLFGFEGIDLHTFYDIYDISEISFGPFILLV